MPYSWLPGTGRIRALYSPHVGSKAAWKFVSSPLSYWLSPRATTASAPASRFAVCVCRQAVSVSSEPRGHAISPAAKSTGSAGGGGGEVGVGEATGVGETTGVGAGLGVGVGGVGDGAMVGVAVGGVVGVGLGVGAAPMMTSCGGFVASRLWKTAVSLLVRVSKRL